MFRRKPVFSKRDVMLGVLKNSNQELYNLQKGFYHIPEEWIRERKLPRYVALIRDKRAYSEKQTGVYFYGKVDKAILFRRRDLKDLETREINKNKLYWKLVVEKWMMLENPIEIGGISIDVNAFTSQYQFFNSKDTAELLLEKRGHWDFYKACSDLFRDTKILGPFGKADTIKFDKYIAKLSENKIDIFFQENKIKTIKIFCKSIQDFKREIRSFESMEDF